MVDLHALSPMQLQQLLEDHPWFTVARREAISRMGDDEAALRRAVGRDAVFFLSRDEMFRLLTGKVPVAAPAAEKQQRPQYYVVGGDYFGKEDFERLDREGHAGFRQERRQRRVRPRRIRRGGRRPYDGQPDARRNLCPAGP